jgi:predicted cytidylate kinase
MKFGERTISSISVGGLVCSGKTTLANLLAKEFGWTHINSGERVRTLVQESGLPIEKFGSLDDIALRIVDDKITREMAAKDLCIWEGRLTPWLSRQFPNYLRIYCVASQDVRAHRYAKREDIDITKASQLIHKREEEEANVFNRLYGLTDLLASSALDLTLDTSKRTADLLLSEIQSRLYSD